MKHWKRLKQKRAFFMFFSSLVFVMAVAISFSMFYKTSRTIEEIDATKNARAQVSLTLMQLKTLNVNDIESPPHTYYLENIDATTLPQIDNYTVSNKLITSSKEKVGAVLDNFFVLQESYKKSLDAVHSLNSYLENRYTPSNNSEMTTLYFDLLSLIKNMPDAIMQELEMLKNNEEISVGSLNETLMQAKTNYQQLEGVCFPKNSTSQFVAKLSAVVDDMQDMLISGEKYFASYEVAMNTLTMLGSDIDVSNTKQVASNQKSSTILLVILGILMGIIALSLYLLMKPKNFMLMNASTKEDLESENLQSIKSSVETLIQSVNQTWVDSQQEKTVLNDMRRESNDIDTLLTNIETEVTEVQKDSNEINTIRRMVEELYGSGEMIQKDRLLPIIKMICDLEIKIYEHEEELQTDVEAMGRTVFSIRHDLDTLQKALNKLIHDTEELRTESRDLEENKTMIDLWDE